MRPEHTSNQILIAGGGPAGLLLGTKLTENNYPVQVIQDTNRMFTPSSQESPDVIYSTPIISRKTAGLMGVSVKEEEVVRGLRSLDDTGENTLLWAITVSLNQWVQRYPYCIFSYQEIMQQLSDTAESRGVSIQQGKVTDVLYEKKTKNKVTGAVVNGEEVRSSYVLDATGRNAHVIQNIQRECPNLVHEYRLPQASIISGGYIQLPEELPTPSLQAHFDDYHTVGYVTRLPGNLLGFLAPIQKYKQSPATHLLLIEGDPSTIITAEKKVGKQDKESKESTFRRVVEHVTQKSRLADLLETMSGIYGRLRFSYTDAVFRNIQLAGVSCIGDSLRHANPLLGEGFHYMSREAEALMSMLSSMKSIESAGESYNKMQARRNLFEMYKMRLFFSTAKRVAGLKYF